MRVASSRLIIRTWATGPICEVTSAIEASRHRSIHVGSLAHLLPLVMLHHSDIRDTSRSHASPACQRFHAGDTMQTRKAEDGPYLGCTERGSVQELTATRWLSFRTMAQHWVPADSREGPWSFRHPYTARQLGLFLRRPVTRPCCLSPPLTRYCARSGHESVRRSTTMHPVLLKCRHAGFQVP
jgi:hypothetical protein